MLKVGCLSPLKSLLEKLPIYVRISRAVETCHPGLGIGR